MLYLLQYAKSDQSGLSNAYLKIQAYMAFAVIELHLTEGISKSVTWSVSQSVSQPVSH